MDVWSEMAKEVKQNFGSSNGVKTIPKANTDSSGSGNADKELGMKSCASDGLDTITRNGRTATETGNGVKLKVDTMKTSLPTQQTVFSSPQESVGGKHFSTDSNSSGVQSNSYSDLSEVGGCATIGMETSSPEGTHRNLVQHISKGQCRGGQQNLPIMSVPQHPPPNYDSVGEPTQPVKYYPTFDICQSKTSINILSQADAKCTVLAPASVYPYTSTSSQQCFSPASGNRVVSGNPLPLSDAQLREVQTMKNKTVHGAKQSNIYSYQPVSGKVQIQRSTYDLRQSSKMAELPMRPINASNETIDQIPSCRLRYGVNTSTR